MLGGMNERPLETGGASRRDLAVILLLLAVTAAAHGVWIQRDLSAPGLDELRSIIHMERGLQQLHRDPWGGGARLFVSSEPHPPGVPIGALPFYAAGDHSFTAARGSSLLYHLLAVLGAWLLGRRCLGRLGGRLMAFATAFAPFGSTHAHRLLLEGPVAAVLPYALLALLASEGFRRRGPAFLFGLAVGWMLLLKWTAVLFVVGPALVALVEGVRRSGRGVAFGLGLAALGSAIAAPWYVTHLGHLLEFAAVNEANFAVNPGFHPHASRLEPGALAFYLLRLPVLFGLPIALAVLAGLAACLVRRRSRTRPLVYMLAAALPPLVVFSSLLTKEIRHLSPAAIPLLLVAVHWIVGLERPFLRRGLATAFAISVVLWGVLPMAGIGPAQTTTWPARGVNRVTLWPAAKGPERRPWPRQEILSAIDTDRRSRGLDRARVLVLPYAAKMNIFLMAHLAARRRLPLAFTDFPIQSADLGRVNEADYILTLASPPGFPFPAQLFPWMQLSRWLMGAIPPGPPPQVERLATFALPIPLEAVVYRRRGRLGVESERAMARAILAAWPGHQAVQAFLDRLDGETARSPGSRPARRR